MGGVVRLFRMGLSNFSSSLDTSKAESEAREKWLRKSSESSSRFSSHPLHSHFSLDLLQKIVALTGTALDSGEPLARAGDQISSADETDATTALVARIVWRAKTAGRERDANRVDARGGQGERELVKSS